MRSIRVGSAVVLVAAMLGAREAGSQCLQSRLDPCDAALGQRFGNAVAAEGDRIVVGAMHDDDAGTDAGAVYVLRRVGAAWTLEQKLISPAPQPNQGFGRSVGLSGDRMLVGAQIDNSTSFGTSPGAAYVFRLQGGVWVFEVELGQLLSSAPLAGDLFGFSVAIAGDLAVVGAFGTNFPSTPGGAAYVFVRDAMGWQPDPGASPNLVGSSNARWFGRAVATDGIRIVIGDARDGEAATNAGAASVFVRDAMTSQWTREAKLTPPGPIEGRFSFGDTVAIDSSTGVSRIVVGAPYHGAACSDESGSSFQGAAFVFRWTGTVWLREGGALAAPDAGCRDEFGGNATAVAIEGDRIAVSAIQHASGAPSAGSVYLFRRDDGGTAGDPSDDSWSLASAVRNPEPETLDQFGTAIALDGSLLVAGQPLDDGRRTDSGTVFTFDVGPECLPSPFSGNVRDPMTGAVVPRLFANGDAGCLTDIGERVVRVAQRAPIELELFAAPSGPAMNARYVVWAWLGAESNPSFLDVGTSVLGYVVNPTPLQPFAMPQAAFCLMGEGLSPVFCAGLRPFRSRPSAPWAQTKTGGLRRPIRFTLQGILEDMGAASSDGFSVTNALVVDVR